MDPVTLILATTNEISLKGGNRSWFERTLTANVRRALAGLPVAAVRRPSWRVLISFSEPVDFDAVAERLGTVFGLNSLMPVRFAGQTLAALDTSRLEVERRRLQAQRSRAAAPNPMNTLKKRKAAK